MGGLSVFLTGIIILAVLYLIGCFCIAWIMIDSRIRPRGQFRRGFDQVRREQHDLDGFDFAPYDRAPKEEFLLRSGGLSIAGEFIPAKNPPPGRPRCVIRVHGFTQNRLISVRFIEPFQDMGYSAVIYDQRCFGNSSGKICSFGLFEREDLSVVIDWVKERLGEDTFIVVHGESMGAMTCLLALEREKRIDCVVADCGGSNFYGAAKAMIKNMLHLPPFPIVAMADLLSRRYGFSLGQIDVSPRIAGSDKPILFIHGTADREVPCYMSEEMYRLSKNPLSRLEIFEGAEHGRSCIKDPARYVRAEREFVRAVEETQGLRAPDA
jgi:pimeloyl-ACP methyl ester carboxylesterase